MRGEETRTTHRPDGGGVCVGVVVYEKSRDGLMWTVKLDARRGGMRKTYCEGHLNPSLNDDG